MGRQRVGEQAFPEMTARAAEAFDDWVDLGPDRSLPALARAYQTRTEAVPTKQLSTLKEWSARYRWQDRLSVAVTARTAKKLEIAEEIDADSFVRTSRIINDRLKIATREHADVVVKLREAVRKPVAKGGTTVTVSIEIRQEAEKIAAKYGVPVERVIREAEAIAAGKWDEWSPQP